MYSYNKFAFLSLLIIALSYTACGDDDTVVPPVDELITTVIITLSPTAGGDDVVASYVDLDGFGGTAPVIGNLDLMANTTYMGSVEFLNQVETPEEDITAEIKEEDEEHQVFYTFTSGLGLTVDYQDQDSNGKPLGLITTITTGDSGSGNLTITLRHEPAKDATGVAEGDLTNAGGETDIETTFPVSIQ